MPAFSRGRRERVDFRREASSAPAETWHRADGLLRYVCSCTPMLVLTLARDPRFATLASGGGGGTSYDPPPPPGVSKLSVGAH